MPSSDTTYNGWANYETWAVGMFLDGNYTGEATYRDVLDLVKAASKDINQANVAEGIWTEDQARLFSVEDALKDWTREEIEGDIEGIAADLLRGALDEVNWRELAGHKLDEISEES